MSHARPRESVEAFFQLDCVVFNRSMRCREGYLIPRYDPLEQKKTYPTLASATWRAYLANTPRLTLSGRSFHSTRRRATSSSETSQSIVRAFESILIRSPSWTSAIGPPLCASGQRCYKIQRQPEAIVIHKGDVHQ